MYCHSVSSACFRIRCVAAVDYFHMHNLHFHRKSNKFQDSLELTMTTMKIREHVKVNACLPAYTRRHCKNQKTKSGGHPQVKQERSHK